MINTEVLNMIAQCRKEASWLKNYLSDKPSLFDISFHTASIEFKKSLNKFDLYLFKYPRALFVEQLTEINKLGHIYWNIQEDLAKNLQNRTSIDVLEVGDALKNTINEILNALSSLEKNYLTIK